MSPRITYEAELERLREDTEKIGEAVQNVYGRLFEALKEKKEDELSQICESEHDIHMMQRSIEGSCLNLITKQQPIASDLRRVTAVLKSVNDISRIGDQCADIAELLLRMQMKELSAFSAHISDMIDCTQKQLADSVEAFLKRDVIAASSVISKDDLVDEFFNRVKEDLISHLKEGTKDADDCVDILMIAKHLEKTGDHAVNIAEWTVFRETGEFQEVRLL